jgi:hypothetical protein
MSGDSAISLIPLILALDLPIDQPLNGVLRCNSVYPRQSFPLGYRSSLLFGRPGDETL